ncbi:MAG: flagellar motor protein MotB [Phycisphaerales bacterium JB039]
MNSMRRNGVFRSALKILAAATVAAGALGGCATGNPDDALVQENLELRQQRAELEQQLAECEQRYAMLDEQNRQLGQLGSDTGFEGIDGVTIGRSQGELTVGIAGDVLFASGSAALRPEAKRSLDQVVANIRQRYPGKTIRVEGHTDTDPIRKSKWETNERLSAERAMAVEAYLVSKGLDNKQVYSAAFGSAQPRGSKKDSRRVEIVIIE